MFLFGKLLLVFFLFFSLENIRVLVLIVVVVVFCFLPSALLDFVAAVLAVCAR